MTEREELARIIDPQAFEMLNAKMPGDEQAFIRELQDEALAKADQWLSRPSPVDGVVEVLRAVREWDSLYDSLPDLLANQIGDAIAAYDRAKGGV
jgi:hypothetical protein